MVGVIVSIQSGCKVTENTYRKVATDPHVTERKKAIIAPKMAMLFPAETTYVAGEDIITIDTVNKYDTTYYAYSDTITREVVKTVTRTVARVDTIYRADGFILSEERRKRVQAEGDAIISKAKEEAARAEVKEVKASRRTLWYWIIGLALAVLVLIYFNVRKLF
jgi:hypothetical protein